MTNLDHLCRRPFATLSYNIQNFDVPYLLKRAKALEASGPKAASTLRSFSEWGRLKGVYIRTTDTMTSQPAILALFCCPYTYLGAHTISMSSIQL